MTQVESGEELTEGSIDPKELLKVKDVHAVQEYLLKKFKKYIVCKVLKLEINTSR